MAMNTLNITNTKYLHSIPSEGVYKPTPIQRLLNYARYRATIYMPLLHNKHNAYPPLSQRELQLLRGPIDHRHLYLNYIQLLLHTHTMI